MGRSGAIDSRCRGVHGMRLHDGEAIPPGVLQAEPTRLGGQSEAEQNSPFGTRRGRASSLPPGAASFQAWFMLGSKREKSLALTPCRGRKTRNAKGLWASQGQIEFPRTRAPPVVSHTPRRPTGMFSVACMAAQLWTPGVFLPEAGTGPQVWNDTALEPRRQFHRLASRATTPERT